MKTCPNCKRLLRVFIFEVVIIITSFIGINLGPMISTIIFSILLFSSTTTSNILVELALTFALVIFLSIFTSNIYALHMPLFAITSIILAYSSNRKNAYVMACLITGLFIPFAFIREISYIDIALMIFSVASLIIHLNMLFKREISNDKIAIISDDHIRDKDIIKIVSSSIKYEKLVAEVVDYDSLDNYQSIIIIADLSYNRRATGIEYSKISKKNILLLYKASYIDDSAYMPVVLRLIKSRNRFMGRYNIFKLYDKSNDQILRDYVSEFALGRETAMPYLLYLTPMIFIDLLRIK